MLTRVGPSGVYACVCVEDRVNRGGGGGGQSDKNIDIKKKVTRCLKASS